MLLSNIIADVMLYLKKVLYVGNIFHNGCQNKEFPLSGGGVQNAKNNGLLLQTAEESGCSLTHTHILAAYHICACSNQWAPQKGFLKPRFEHKCIVGKG